MQPQMRSAFCLVATVSAATIGSIAVAHNNETHVSFEPYSVEILQGGLLRAAGAGIYLGKGFVITAGHVAQLSGAVRGDGQVVVVSLIKRGDRGIDLSLLHGAESNYPPKVQAAHLQLCAKQPAPGTAAVLVTPGRITDTHLVDPSALNPESRAKWGTMIADVETAGRSGSGVFQTDEKCLLGILSALITNNGTQKAIGTFYVSADTIRGFLSRIPAAASLAQ
jgi:hypothetical protein